MIFLAGSIGDGKCDSDFDELVDKQLLILNVVKAYVLGGYIVETCNNVTINKTFMSSEEEKQEKKKTCKLIAMGELQQTKETNIISKRIIGQKLNISADNIDKLIEHFFVEGYIAEINHSFEAFDYLDKKISKIDKKKRYGEYMIRTREKIMNPIQDMIKNAKNENAIPFKTIENTIMED
jgi:hypothetical protein